MSEIGGPSPNLRPSRIHKAAVVVLAPLQKARAYVTAKVASLLSLTPSAAVNIQGKVKRIVFNTTHKGWVMLLPVRNIVERLFQANTKKIEKEVRIKESLAPSNPKHLDVTVRRDTDGTVLAPEARGNVEQHLGSLSFEGRLETCLMMAKGYEELHAQDVAHGDPKPDNFLIYSDGTVKLSDFEKAREVQGDRAKGTYDGNTRFGPPEGKTSKKGDIYGLGLCMVRVLEEAFLRVKGKDDAMLMTVASRRAAEPNDKRRGIERFMLEHPDCQRTSENVLANFISRIRTEAGAISDETLEKEQQIIHAYIDALCDEMIDKSPLTDQQVERLRVLLKAMTERDPKNRPPAVEARVFLEEMVIGRLGPSEPGKASTTDIKTRNCLEIVVRRESGAFTKFNRAADALKQTGGWEDKIKVQVDSLNEEGVKRLLEVELRDLRGYDREVLGVIYSALGTRLTKTEDVQKVKEILAILETKIIPVAGMKELGRGAVNKVYEITYIDDTGKTKKAVFKPDPAELDQLIVLKEAHFGTAAASGIPPGTDAHLASRAVASSVFDRMLYGDDPISVKTEFAIVNGQRGILMQKAPGKSPEVSGREEIELDPTVRQYLEENKGHLRPDFLQSLAKQLGYERIVRDSQGKWLGFSEFSFNPRNATTVVGVLRLQVFDIIRGEVDRHPGNYFIDLDGKVTGIDQDCSFGVRALPKGVDVRQQPALKGVIPNNASLMLRMPPIVTLEILNQIAFMRKNKGEFETALAPYLNKEEIEATLDRLERLYQHITNPETCLVVPDTAALLSPEALGRINRNNSLLARECEVYDKKIQGWNYMRKYETTP